VSFTPRGAGQVLLRRLRHVRLCAVYVPRAPRSPSTVLPRRCRTPGAAHCYSSSVVSVSVCPSARLPRTTCGLLLRICMRSGRGLCVCVFLHDAAARQVRPIAAAVAWSVCLCVLPRGCHAPRAACCYTCTPGCRLQGRAGSKILHQQNPPVLNWMCRCDYTG